LDGELHSIITEVYRISHLINNILTLSCNSASNSVQVNLNNLILEAISLLEHTLNRKIACTTMLLPDLPPVAGDPVLLHCVFQNILRYAVEASGEDAVPKIQTALGELPPPVPLFSSSTDEPKNGQARQNPTPKDVDKKGKEPSRQIIVRIEDRGPEMAPEALAQLFEPFFTSKTFGIGVGLGLFISKRIIEFHRGQIQVSGESGRGTIFTIILPI
jgi:signal transduction histidine kinase